MPLNDKRPAECEKMLGDGLKLLSQAMNWGAYRPKNEDSLVSFYFLLPSIP